MNREHKERIILISASSVEEACENLLKVRKYWLLRVSRFEKGNKNLATLHTNLLVD